MLNWGLGVQGLARARLRWICPVLVLRLCSHRGIRGPNAAYCPSPVLQRKTAAGGIHLPLTASTPLPPRNPLSPAGSTSPPTFQLRVKAMPLKGSWETPLGAVSRQTAGELCAQTPNLGSGRTARSPTFLVKNFRLTVT